MKIVIATAVYYPQINGVAVFSHNLAEGLAGRGHEVLVLTPSQTGKSHIEEQGRVKVAYLRSVNTRVYPDQINPVPPKKKVLGKELPHLFYRKGFKVSVFPALEVAKVLDEFRPDVVHVQVSDPIGLSVVSYARRHSIPVVTTEHNQPEVLTEPLHVPKLMRKGANAVLAAYFRNRQGKSDFVTMPTEQAIRNLLEKHPIEVPVAAVSNGVDLSNYKPGKAPERIYTDYGISPGVPVVLYVGRVDPEKKVGVVIEAFKKARAKLPKAELVIVGDGVDRVRLEQRYRDGNGVKFLGRVVPPDLYELYRVGDVFATASEIETQGIVLIEAAASGLPLIAVNKGAVAEVCRNGENGFLCEPGSVGEIAEAIEKILADKTLREKFAKKSVEIASEHDFEKTLDKFINIYRKVVEQKVGRRMEQKNS